MSGYDVVTAELTSHASKVAALAARLRGAVDAANTVTMDDSAYGVVCQPFAMLLQPFEEMGVRALQQATDTVDTTAGQVRDTVEGYESNETAEAASFGSIEGAL
ncbi:type VII secretion target [Actinokineospora diospyrosa]|uniref:Excreted virulence factor EspC, type VII ESX diderm n=1 Tax=Actinokineospora diospyrosa TaxID=103728 RepID=A0ABT1IC73_9PSEU|nr:type VII secretion target [Actinokineospora diospyrosa]MCP2270224.1 Excreted virulence factor EspC, type VII ESX diderm [Actinokineospora diospyrosa]